MIVHVVRRARDAGAREVVVATDDARIANTLMDLEVDVEMTRLDHASGSDRLAEVIELRGWSDDTIIVNLQGDEPMAPASGTRRVAYALAANKAPMATLATPIISAEELRSNCVKVVRDMHGALYFSRAPMRGARPSPPTAASCRTASVPAPHRHLCVSREVLRADPAPRCWKTESLEQLRALERHSITSPSPRIRSRPASTRSRTSSASTVR